MSKIKNIALGIILSGITLTTTSCKQKISQQKKNRIENLLNNYTTDSKKISSTWRPGIIGKADAQSSLDSVIFKNIFNSTNAISDSNKVNEFNKIASNNRIPEYIKTKSGAHFHLYRKIRENTNTIQESKQIRLSLGSFFANKNDTLLLEKKQYVLDSIKYTKFFEKYNLNDSITMKTIEKNLKKIRP